MITLYPVSFRYGCSYGSPCILLLRGVILSAEWITLCYLTVGGGVGERWFDKLFCLISSFQTCAVGGWVGWSGLDANNNVYFGLQLS